MLSRTQRKDSLFLTGAGKSGFLGGIGLSECRSVKEMSGNGESGRWRGRPLVGPGRKTGNSLAAALPRAVRRTRHAQKNQHGKNRDTGCSNHRRSRWLADFRLAERLAATSNHAIILPRTPAAANGPVVTFAPVLSYLSCPQMFPRERGRCSWPSAFQATIISLN